jgi:hypothetical protein
VNVVVELIVLEGMVDVEEMDVKVIVSLKTVKVLIEVVDIVSSVVVSIIVFDVS